MPKRKRASAPKSPAHARVPPLPAAVAAVAAPPPPPPRASHADERRTSAHAAASAHASHASFGALVGVGDHSDQSDDDASLEAIALSSLPAAMIEMAVNDEAALEKKLCDIALFTDVAGRKALPFEHSLVLTMGNAHKLSDSLALDDLQRETSFAQLAAEAVHLGLDRLRSSNIKFRRPADYFAEMVKTDAHMAKVKTHVLEQKERIEDAEKRRNDRHIKKSRKKVRAQQLQREQDNKRKAKDEIAAYSRLRKQRLRERQQRNNDDEDDEFPIDLLDVEQLDSENRFQSHSDIASGKKQAWRPKTARRNAPHHTGVTNRSKSAQRTANYRKRTLHANGGVSKPKGKKKRLGKSRRMANKS